MVQALECVQQTQNSWERIPPMGTAEGMEIRPVRVSRTERAYWAASAIACGLLTFVLLSATNAEQPQVDVAAGEVRPRESDYRAKVLESFRHDATLADICFVDRSRGWAIGDRGVIWHSSDGGATWDAQSSGVQCRLNGVYFVDAERGWIVGGQCLPGREATRGVVLRTADGGKHWSLVPRLVLPLLRSVKFFDAENGIAVGASSAYDQSGMFITHDGGDDWQPVPTDRAGGWIAGDFLDMETGAVAGPAGRYATLARRKLVRSPMAGASLHSYHAMRLVGATGGWLVGDGGVVMTTRDSGHSWQSPPGELPEVAAEHFDFHAVAVQGRHVWVAGSPGTCVFHSPDNGEKWQAASTGLTVPVRALTFVDAEHGWAAGDLGSILVTNDGGSSWRLQRGGAKRAGVLAVFADAADVPLELLAAVGAADRFVTAVEVLQTPASSTGAHASQDRTREAMLLAGAAAAETAWRFPLPADELALAPADVLAALNRANDGRAIEQLERHLVRRLRMWRPDVVVTSDMDIDRNEPRNAVVVAALRRALEAAADPARYVELADAGLAAWAVKKVYGVLPVGSRGNESIVAGSFSPQLNTTYGDFVVPARHLLAPGQIEVPSTCELQLWMRHIDDAGGLAGLFSGIPAALLDEVRRPAAELIESDPAEARRLATRRHHLQELIARNENSPAWLAQFASLTQDLRPGDGAELTAQLAERFRREGQLDLAADTYYLLARRYPDHALADPALEWLVKFYASGEAAHRAAARTGTNVRQATFQEHGPADPAAGLSREGRCRRAIQLAEYLRTTKPQLYAEPAVRFAEVAAQRQLGFDNPARRYYLTLRQLPEEDAWRQCAESEEWLARPEQLPPPKPVATCQRAQQAPLLDGRFDEPLWKVADALRLRGSGEMSAVNRAGGGERDNAPDTETPSRTNAEIRLAYDEEFLYVAIRCPKLGGGVLPPEGTPRPRDADLSGQDRVTLRIDTNRDYGTAFELAVDARGWTRDACWGDVHWNPRWYVAAGGDETSWTIEAAVPLAELVGDPPAARHVWALGARRTVPRVGYESWSGPPDDANSPAQFGLLIFE
jgi:photosystem II stability/assembly factor-like uncharacterized protein